MRLAGNGASLAGGTQSLPVLDPTPPGLVSVLGPAGPKTADVVGRTDTGVEHAAVNNVPFDRNAVSVEVADKGVSVAPAVDGLVVRWRGRQAVAVSGGGSLSAGVSWAA